MIEKIMTVFGIGDYNDAISQIQRSKDLKNNAMDCTKLCKEQSATAKKNAIAKQKDPTKKKKMEEARSARPYGGHHAECPQGRMLNMKKRWALLTKQALSSSLTAEESAKPHLRLQSFVDGKGPNPTVRPELAPNANAPWALASRKRATPSDSELDEKPYLSSHNTLFDFSQLRLN